MYAATVKDGLVSAVEYLTLDGERKIFGVRKLEVKTSLLLFKVRRARGAFSVGGEGQGSCISDAEI